MFQSQPQTLAASPLRQSLPGPLLVDPKRPYSTVPQEVRLTLLRLIENEQLTIKEAAKRLEINYSTAKHIVKLFRLEKRVSTLPKIGRKAVPGASKSGSVGSESRMPVTPGEHVPPTNEQVKERPGEEPKKRTLKRFIARKTRLDLDEACADNHEPERKSLRPAVDEVVGTSSSQSGTSLVTAFNFGFYGPEILKRYAANK